MRPPRIVPLVRDQPAIRDWEAEQVEPAGSERVEVGEGCAS